MITVSSHSASLPALAREASPAEAGAEAARHLLKRKAKTAKTVENGFLSLGGLREITSFLDLGQLIVELAKKVILEIRATLSPL